MGSQNFPGLGRKFVGRSSENFNFYKYLTYACMYIRSLRNMYGLG